MGLVCLHREGWFQQPLVQLGSGAMRRQMGHCLSSFIPTLILTRTILFILKSVKSIHCKKRQNPNRLALDVACSENTSPASLSYLTSKPVGGDTCNKWNRRRRRRSFENWRTESVTRADFYFQILKPSKKSQNNLENRQSRTWPLRKQTSSIA